MNARFRVVMLVVFSLLLLAMASTAFACGGDETPTPTPPAPPTETPTLPPTVPPPSPSPTPTEATAEPWREPWAACGWKQEDVPSSQLEDWLKRCAAAPATPTPVCEDCPPAACGLTEGHFVRVVIGSHEYYWGLDEGNQLVSFNDYAEGEASGLTFWGTECSLCALNWAVVGNTAFYGPGMTEWDLALALAGADGRDRANLLDRDFEAAHRIAVAWYDAGQPDQGGWYTITQELRGNP